MTRTNKSSKGRKASSPEKVVSKKKTPKPIASKQAKANVEKLNREPLPKTKKFTAPTGRTIVADYKPPKGRPVAIQSGRAPHGIVRARAGTGKTFTQIVGVASMFRDVKIEGSFTFRGPRGGKLDTMQASTLWGKVEREMSRFRNPLTGLWQYPDTIKRIVPSTEQKAVWDFMAMEKPRTVCYVAFNNSIVDDFSEKYDWLVQLLDSVGVKLEFSTIHSMGNAACRRAYDLRGWKSLNKYKVSDLLSALWQKDLKEVWKEEAENIQAIQELVGLVKQTDPYIEKSTDDDLEALSIHYGIDMVDKEKVFTAVHTLIDQCKEVTKGDRIDFNDMIWLPVINRLPVEQYDLLLVDESQDLNRCQQELVLKVGRRIILVGDERQAIYGFAGADTDSIDRMAGMLQGSQMGIGNLSASGRHLEQLRLTETRRCGKAIVREANRLVEDFTAHKENGEGKVTRIQVEELRYDEGPKGQADDESPEISKLAHCYSLGEADFVLCRTNAPLVSLAFKMLKAGKRVNIKGRDIGDGLKAFIKKSKCKEVGDFLVWLDEYEKTQSERIQKRRWVDDEALITLQDRCMCLRTFADGALSIKDMYQAINDCFKGKVCPKCNKSFDEKTKCCYDCKEGNNAVKLVTPEGTMCSSIHRAKGMEAKRVFILRPDLLPHPKAKTEWEKGQEANLHYVAITRAIDELIYVEGKEKVERE